MTTSIKKIIGIEINSIKKIENKNIGIEFYSNSLYNDANCLSYWRLEGNSNDTKGAHNGTDTNITYGTQYGRFNQGALFNGSTSKILTANNSGISGNAAFSFSIWIKPTDLALYSFMDVGVNAGGTAATFLMTLGSSGNFGISFSGSLNALSNGSIIQTGIWQHLVVTKAAGAINTTTKLYYNGIEVSLATGAPTNTPNISNTPITIGYSTTYGSFNFKGSLDEPIFFNRVLTSTEVLSIYSNQIKKVIGVSNV